MKSPAGVPVDPLVLLQLRVARRADELAAHVDELTSQVDRRAKSLNLTCWLKAEEEVFALKMAPPGLLERLTPHDS